jgi:hypothetical protein
MLSGWAFTQLQDSCNTYDNISTAEIARYVV